MRLKPDRLVDLRHGVIEFETEDLPFFKHTCVLNGYVVANN